MCSLKVFCVLAGMVSFLACSGGGSGGGGSSLPSLQVSPNSLAVTATTEGLSAPQAFVQVDLQGTIPDGGLWIGWHYSTNGISQIREIPTDYSGLTLEVLFRNPQDLSLGTHTDTIAIRASTDEAGTSQVPNSPQYLEVTYRVLLPAPQITSLNPVSACVGGPAFTLTLTGSGFPGDAQIQLNGTAMATTVVSSTRLEAAIPASAIASGGNALVTVTGPNLTTSTPIQFPIANSQARFLDIPAASLAWDGVHQTLYAGVLNIIGNQAVVGSNIPYANSIVAIDPATGQVLGSVATGGGTYPPVAGPIAMTVSDDGGYLYAITIPYVSGQSVTIQRYFLPSLTLDGSFSVSLGGDYWPMGIAVAPGAPHTLAVARYKFGTAAGAAIFDDNVQRGPWVLDEFTSKNYFNLDLAWGSDASTLYGLFGYGLSTLNDEYVLLSVDSSGPALQRDVTYPGQPSGNPLQTSGYDLHWVAGTGHLYRGDGKVLDPATGQVLGHCGSGSLGMVPDPGTGIGYYLDTTGSGSSGMFIPSIRAYDLATFAALGSTTVPMVSVPNSAGFQPAQILRCGPSLLVLRGGSAICVVTGPFAQGQ